MKPDNLSIKLLYIGLIGMACYLASLLIMGLISDREYRFAEAQSEVATSWGDEQLIFGPVLILKSTEQTEKDVYILPTKVSYEVTLVPEIRSRGIFDSVVYTEALQVTGAFSSSDFQRLSTELQQRRFAVFSVGVSDTRGIEERVNLQWGTAEYTFQPGSESSYFDHAGIHAVVPLVGTDEHLFSFKATVRGSRSAKFIPVGEETRAHLTSSWSSPEFIGAFLPTERNIASSGFDGTWRISSFGRPYAQVFEAQEVEQYLLSASAFGVGLHEGVGLYTKIYRSVAYAILFIVVTFATFFLFEVLARIRIHSVQYLLVGAGLALFYLLLLSLAEHIGFLAAYALATGMVAVLITMYSAKVLRSYMRAGTIFLVLVSLYGYLYFVLHLEDYALLFGSLLLFVLLAAIMYLTRNIDWFAQSKDSSDSNVQNST